ncbi:MAG: type IX secretion system protein PorQ [Dysgonamonadaceae bacterium]|jgi:hypothetical protein|nr:type IX secretion system protein PorQ [Dysgonamonadaceae bacterium]
MRRLFLVPVLFFLVFPAWTQEGNSGFDYLLLPHSARASALGGTNVSIVENDVSLIYNNPAFLGPEMDRTLNASYLSYIADIGVGNVVFAKSIGDRGAWGVGALYAHYGKMKEVTDEDIALGDLTANDICAAFFFSHDLTDKIRGGATGKFLYSNYYHNTAIGLGVDLGLSYYDEAHDFSIGLVGKNIGRQVKAYEEELAALPWDIQLGISKSLNHAPIRFSVTGVYLKQWRFDNPDGTKDAFLKTLGKHLILGIDIIPSDNFWVGVGYNLKRNMDMRLQEGNKFGGFSIGAGLKVKSFAVSCAVGKYNLSATSFLLSLSTSFAEMKL